MMPLTQGLNTLAPWHLTKFERDVLENIAADNEPVRDLLLNSIPDLRVSSRELTGVGAYINLACDRVFEGLGDAHLGLSFPINIPSLEYGLTTELACSGGKPLFIELCSTGSETWTGEIEGYSFTAKA